MDGSPAMIPKHTARLGSDQFDAKGDSAGLDLRVLGWSLLSYGWFSTAVEGAHCRR